MGAPLFVLVPGREGKACCPGRGLGARLEASVAAGRDQGAAAEAAKAAWADAVRLLAAGASAASTPARFRVDGAAPGAAHGERLQRPSARLPAANLRRSVSS